MFPSFLGAGKKKALFDFFSKKKAASFLKKCYGLVSAGGSLRGRRPRLVRPRQQICWLRSLDE